MICAAAHRLAALAQQVHVVGKQLLRGHVCTWEQGGEAGWVPARRIPAEVKAQTTKDKGTHSCSLCYAKRLGPHHCVLRLPSQLQHAGP